MRMMPPRTYCCRVLICDRQIPTKFLMCREHWFMVPKQLRDRIWKSIDLEPGKYLSLEYDMATDMAIKHVMTTIMGVKN